MREKFKKGEIVSATRTFNGEIITGEFRGYHLFNDEIPDTVVGIVHVPGDGVYDVDVTSLRHCVKSTRYSDDEDEKITKAFIRGLKNDIAEHRYETIYGIKLEEALSWFEKRKESNTDYLSTHIETLPDGGTVWHSIGYLEKQKEQKPMDKIDLKFNIGDTIVNKKNGEKCTISNRCLLHQYYSDTNHCHEIKFDEQDDWELVEQKEQDKCPEYCVRSHCIGCSIYEKQKEKKPILEVFGFKVGDAVRLKDGDGRKHIIKSFEEVEGVHGPNFYHVEFEDNSARDGIYPGEEYPNGYYTQMEKFEEEQKPADYCSVRDEFDLDGNLNQKSSEQDSEEVFDKIDKSFRKGREVGFQEGVESVKSTEWSEEDDRVFEFAIARVEIYERDFLHGNNEMSERLKALHPRPSWKPSDEQIKALEECGECKRCIKELREQLKSYSHDND